MLRNMFVTTFTLLKTFIAKCKLFLHNFSWEFFFFLLVTTYQHSRWSGRSMLIFFLMSQAGNFWADTFHSNRHRGFRVLPTSHWHSLSLAHVSAFPLFSFSKSRPSWSAHRKKGKNNVRVKANWSRVSTSQMNQLVQIYQTISNFANKWPMCSSNLATCNQV